MKKYFTLLRRRVKGKSGFTLAEMMITMLILLMMTTVVAAGMPSAVNAYRRAIDAANAQILLTDTVMRLRSELAVATNVVLNDETSKIVKSYTSGNSGWTISLINSDDGIKTNDNRIDSEGEAKGWTQNKEQLLVPEKMNGAVANKKKLITSFKSITYDKTTGVFTISGLRVSKVDEDKGAPAYVDGKTGIVEINSIEIRNIIPKFSEQEGEGG